MEAARKTGSLASSDKQKAAARKIDLLGNSDKQKAAARKVGAIADHHTYTDTPNRFVPHDVHIFSHESFPPPFLLSSA